MPNKNVDVYTLIKPEIIKLINAGVETANLDCRLLLSKSLNRNSILYNHEKIIVSKYEIQKFHSLIKQRLSGKPVSRIINKKNFWKKEFKINDTTLDPRPDSETLIETVLEYYKDKSQFLKILDLGSGSGCIGLSLLDEFPNSVSSFFDISKQSLEIVKLNASNFGLSDRSKFIYGDWKTKDWDLKLIEVENRIKFDIVISNPPYIATDNIKTLQREVKKYDPFIALDGGKDGLEAYKYILSGLKRIIKKNGKIFIEIGKCQEDSVSSIAFEHDLIVKKYSKDLSGVNRVITFVVK